MTGSTLDQASGHRESRSVNAAFAEQPRLPTAVRESRSVNSPAHHQLGKSCSVNLALVTHPDLGEGNSLTSPKPKIVWREHVNHGYLVRYW